MKVFKIFTVLLIFESYNLASSTILSFPENIKQFISAAFRSWGQYLHPDTYKLNAVIKQIIMNTFYACLNITYLCINIVEDYSK